MRIAIGLSGGVDSCMAAYLLKRAGHDVVGVTMRLAAERPFPVPLAGKACFGPGESAASIAAARAFAERIGIPYRVFDAGDAYRTTVLDYFTKTYLDGKTPNPCVLCNATMKFGLLPRLAREGGVAFDAFATGHYARVRRQANGRIALLAARDRAKDQSYFLYRLSQEQLANLVLPLGEHAKETVRALAAEAGFEVARAPDSQDFYSGSRDDLIGLPPRPGDIVDAAGTVLGRHTGHWHYTVGQRRGLKVPGAEPHYVIRVNAERNEVVVGTRDEACATDFRVTDFNWVSIPPPREPLACRVKIRSTGAATGPALLTGARCHVPAGLFAVSPGQSAVFYGDDGETVLGGGVITG